MPPHGTAQEEVAGARSSRCGRWRTGGGTGRCWGCAWRRAVGPVRRATTARGAAVQRVHLVVDAAHVRVVVDVDGVVRPWTRIVRGAGGAIHSGGRRRPTGGAVRVAARGGWCRCAARGSVLLLCRQHGRRRPRAILAEREHLAVGRHGHRRCLRPGVKQPLAALHGRVTDTQRATGRGMGRRRPRGRR